jgi:hypothetical protein
MTVMSMTFLAPHVNGDDLTDFIGQTVRLTGKAFNDVFDGEDVELTLETPDGTHIKVIKAGVSLFLLKSLRESLKRRQFPEECPMIYLHTNEGKEIENFHPPIPYLRDNEARILDVVGIVTAGG